MEPQNLADDGSFMLDEFVVTANKLSKMDKLKVWWAANWKKFLLVAGSISLIVGGVVAYKKSQTTKSKR